MLFDCTLSGLQTQVVQRLSVHCAGSLCQLIELYKVDISSRTAIQLTLLISLGHVSTDHALCAGRELTSVPWSEVTTCCLALVLLTLLDLGLCTWLEAMQLLLVLGFWAPVLGASYLTERCAHIIAASLALQMS